jgi:DNA-binding SARP family transcriptional activator
MQFRVLGPLEVVERERPLPLGGVRQRSLLAVLLQHPNEVVSVDHLLEELWGCLAPPTAAKSIQVYIYRLRKLLGQQRLVTRPPGYALTVDAGEVDLDAFERLRAAGRMREALSLWRGPPYADLAYEPCVQAERARLAELRLSALEERIDGDLAAGRNADVVGELEALIAEHPLRERPRAQLMLALYRSGRQAEALNAYQSARRVLTDDLGLEPSGELKRLERAILLQDPGLDVPTPPAAERSLLVVPSSQERLEALLALAVPLAAAEPREVVLARVVPPLEVGSATLALADRAARLGVVARAAAFSSPTPGADIARLARREGSDLLLVDALDSSLLEEATCDVALLVGDPGSGPVLVPFGAGHHDWAALELGAWFARATGAPLRLVGAATARRGRDASRVLADASLIVQRRTGIVAEPLLSRPGRRGLIALAADAGVLVVGFPDGWRTDGLGRLRTQLLRAPPAPTVLVRRGAGSTGPPLTRFTWSVT